MTLPRAVITGCGCLSPLGDTAQETWAGMASGKNGIAPIENIQLDDDLNIKIGGQVKRDLSNMFEKRLMRMYDRFSLLAIAAAQEALAHSGLEITEENAPRVGAVIGVGNCGWEAVEEGFIRALVEGKKRSKIFAVPRAMPSAPACNVSMQLGLQGPTYGVTSACSSSNHAFASALQMIRAGQADVVVAGGAEAPIMFGVLRAWEALRIVAPDRCSPFDLERRGLVLGEGSGVVILETLEHAQARGATIHAEFAGAGSSADAGDLVIPKPAGPTNAIRNCLNDAKLNPEDVDYINAHGTGTKANDAIECGVIRTVFGEHADRLSLSSTKSMHGHALGGAGAIEMIACIGAVKNNIVPPTINYQTPDPACDLDVTPNEAKEREVKAVLSNAFAFGGLNSVLALKKF
jgi:nodulation protein E